MVLGVHCNGRYGTLGMSRRQDLMDKPLTHRTLGELVAEFESSYKMYQHTLKKVRDGTGRDGTGGAEPSGSASSDLLLPQVKIGLYVPHDPHVCQSIEWKHLVLNAARLGPQEMRKELEKHGRDMRMKVHTNAQLSQLHEALELNHENPINGFIIIRLCISFIFINQRPF